MGIKLENLVVKFGDFKAINQQHFLLFQEYTKYIVERYSLETRMLQD